MSDPVVAAVKAEVPAAEAQAVSLFAKYRPYILGAAVGAALAVVAFVLA